MQSITLIVLYTSILSATIPLIIFFKTRTSSKIPALSYLNFILQLSLVSDLVSLIMAKFGISNIIVVNIFIVLNFCLFSLFYINLLPDRKKMILITLGCFLSFSVVNSLLLQSPFQIQSYPRMLEAVILIIYAFTFFSGVPKETAAPQARSYGLFWINAGIICYYSFNLFIFSFSTYVFKNLSSEFQIIFWSFHNLNNIIKNILFAIGINFAGERVFFLLFSSKNENR